MRQQITILVIMTNLTNVHFADVQHHTYLYF